MENLALAGGRAQLPLLPKSHHGRSVASPLSSREPAAVPNPPSSELKFVTVSHPEDIRRRKDVRTEIRRHVMKGIGLQRRRPKTQMKEKPPSPSPRDSVHEAAHREISMSRSADTSCRVSTPSRSLPTLGSFPIAADNRVMELVRFFNEQRVVYQPFRGIWFEIALTDKGAFHVTLGNAADLWLKMHGGQDSDRNLEMLQYYSLSVSHLRERLNSAVDSISDGMIAHILSHLCLCMRRQDWVAWNAHMDGLAVIAKLRSGLAHLGRGVHTWILLSDLGGSIVHDVPPRLPLPYYLPPPSKISLKGMPSRLQELLLRLEQDSSDLASMSQALESVFVVANAVNINGHATLFWHQDIEAMNLLGPCIHFLLSMPRPSDNLDAALEPSRLIMEMVRLVGLCIVSKLKALFTLNTPEQALLESRFANFMSSYMEHLDSSYRDLKIWALITACLLQHRGSRVLYLREIRREMAAIGEENATNLVDIAKEIIWIDLWRVSADELTRDIALHSDESNC